MEEDKYIIENILAGNTNGYRQLVHKYQGPVFRIVLKIVGNNEDAREVTQDVFVKTYESLYQYNNKYKFFSWLYRIAINNALMYMKQKNKYIPIDKIQNQMVDNVESNKSEETRDRFLNQSINMLPEKYKSVILLKYYAGLSYTEIAETTGIPEKKVKSRLFDARKLLKDHLLKINFFSLAS
ncbi:MAG: RNA polymerase sigma factor [Prolixibacteraceae bacterium]|nr:RNA polymerase sigma factor [Prolixibacteraceae bacterium]